MAKTETPEDILETELKEIHSAERQLGRVAKKLVKAAGHPRIAEMLEERRERGERIVEEIDSILEDMGAKKSRPKNVAAEGLIQDVLDHVDEIDSELLLDPVMIGGLQKLEHYCIAAWGTTRSMGRLLGEDEVVQLMERLLEEGRAYDEALTRLAEDEVNPRMLDEGEDAEAEQEEAPEMPVAAIKKGAKAKGEAKPASRR